MEEEEEADSDDDDSYQYPCTVEGLPAIPRPTLSLLYQYPCPPATPPCPPPTLSEAGGRRGGGGGFIVEEGDATVDGEEAVIPLRPTLSLLLLPPGARS